MEPEGWRFEGFDTPAILFLGACVLLFMLTISYVIIQHHFLRYLEKESKADYEQLGRPDPWLRTRQDGGYFPFDLYIFTKRYSALRDPSALQMAKRIRELLFTMFALMTFALGCVVYLHYT
jgi:hypothetical protein